MSDFISYNEQLLKYKEKVLATKYGIFPIENLKDESLEINTEIPYDLKDESIKIDTNKDFLPTLITNFKPKAEDKRPSPFPPISSFDKIIEEKANPATLNNNTSKDGMAIPADYLKELTNSVPAPTAEDPNATKKQITLKLSNAPLEEVNNLFIRTNLFSPDTAKIAGMGMDIYKDPETYSTNANDKIKLKATGSVGNPLVLKTGIESNTKEDFIRDLTKDVNVVPATDPITTEKKFFPELSYVKLDPVETLFNKTVLFSNESTLISKAGDPLDYKVDNYITDEKRVWPIITDTSKGKGDLATLILKSTITDLVNTNKIIPSTILPNKSPNENADSVSNSLNTVVDGNGIGVANGVYQPAFSTAEGVGELIGSIFTGVTVNHYEEIKSSDIITDFTTRTEKSITGSNLKMFLFSLIPYQLGKAAEVVAMIRNEVTSFGRDAGDAAVAQLGTYQALMATASFVSYFTIEELAWSFAATPFTLGFLSTMALIGIQLKDKGNSIKFRKTNILKLELAEIWDNSVDQNLGNSTNKFQDEDFYTPYKNNAVNVWTPLGNNKYNGEKTPTKASNKKIAFSLGMENYEKIFNEIRKKIIGDSTTSSSIMQDYNEPAETANEKLIKLDDETKKKQFYNLVKFTFTEAHFKEKLQQSEFNNNYYPVGLKGNEATEGTEKNVWKTQIEILKELDGFSEKVKNAKDKIYMGFIQVYPTTTDLEIKKFKIPFQFEPKIAESGQTANYQATTALHRLGPAYSYTNTEGQSLTLETDYLILTDDVKDPDRKTDQSIVWKVHEGPQDAFYSVWTIGTVQAVESAFRSLVFPIAQTNTESGDIKFHKPPMVKVVIGQKTSTASTPTETDTRYHMLTYPVGKRFHHKTYIITNVTISRPDDIPYYMDGTIVIPHGFHVSIALSEIDHNYIGASPDFGSYYNSYKDAKENFFSVE